VPLSDVIANLVCDTGRRVIWQLSLKTEWVIDCPYTSLKFQGNKCRHDLDLCGSVPDTIYIF